MNDFMYWVLNMSIAGSFGGLFILLIRRMKRIPRKYIRVLWLIPIIRLFVPIGVTGRYSILNLLSDFAIKTVVINTDTNFSASNYIQQADSYFPIKYKTDALEQLFTIAFDIWIMLAGTLIISFIFMYFIAKKEIKQAIYIEGNIYCSDSVLSAAVYGIFRPRIILPDNLDEESSKLIIMHEQVHIRRRDNLYRTIVILITCFHWFNPLAWIMLKNCIEDIELACDEAVIQNMDLKEQKSYAMTIVKETSEPKFFVTAFGGAKVKVRIANILNYKKITLFSSICFTIFCLSIFIILLTNAEV